MQIQEFKVLKTSKNKDSIFHDGFYYKHMRDNKNSTVFKCRHIIDGKECKGNFTPDNNGRKFKTKDHQHIRMEPIQIDQIVLPNPTQSIKNVYNQKKLSWLLNLDQNY